MQQDDTSVRIRYLVYSLLTVVALAVMASAYSERVLRVSMMPDESPSIQRRKLKPLTDYLVQKIGIKMEYRPMASGEALVDSFVFHELDLVWIDGVALERAKLRSKEQVIPLVQRAAVDTAHAALEKNDHAWTVRADMETELRDKLTAAFLALNRNNAQDREILDLQRAIRYIPAH